MSIYTLTVEFNDGEEPAIGPKTDILGGKAIRVAYFDVADDHFTAEQASLIESAIEEYCDRHHKDDLGVWHKLQFLSQ
ncbi:hypothetical protein [Pantoea ananatis]|uniref:hypothetical protein n=1 Tax=Pantoea ananas TaxID=553 RepID=UPI001B3064E5|nr:hypothetical protein [Pantoea ananatis]